jgi:hypothetical protein
MDASRTGQEEGAVSITLKEKEDMIRINKKEAR